MDNRTVLRGRYLGKLMDLTADSRIKVIYGPTCIGKTVLLRQFRYELVKSGVPDTTIVTVSFDRGYNIAETPEAYLNFLTSACRPGTRYLLVDSAHLSPGYSDVTAAVHRKFESVGIYITVCTNSISHSSDPLWEKEDIAVGIPLYPFTFREYLALRPGDRNAAFSEFMRIGGVPLMYKDLGAEDLSILSQSYAHLVLNMLIMRESKINPTAMGELLFYIIAHTGLPLTMKELIAHSSIVDNRTLEKYLERFTSSGVLYCCDGYQMDRGMKPSAKSVFFSNDIMSGTVFTPRGIQPAPAISLLYNLVYIELRVRGYKPSILIAKGGVVGFCVGEGGDRVIIRVAESVDYDRTTPTFSTYRSSLQRKVLLTLEQPRPDYSRYCQRNIVEFLLDDRL